MVPRLLLSFYNFYYYILFEFSFQLELPVSQVFARGSIFKLGITLPGNDAPAPKERTHCEFFFYI